MKRLVLIVAILFLTAGLASAANIPGSFDTKNSREIWITQVVNNESSTTMDVGDCAEWDIGSSTGDELNYVTACDSADTFLVAGVVWPADIAAGDSGIIVIKGPVDVDLNHAAAAGDAICSSATADGGFGPCSDTTGAGVISGFVTEAGSGTKKAYIFVE